MEIRSEVGDNRATGSRRSLSALPMHILAKLKRAELYHHLFKYRWFLNDAAGDGISLMETLDSYIADVLVDALGEANTARCAPT